LRTITYRLDF